MEVAALSIMINLIFFLHLLYIIYIYEFVYIGEPNAKPHPELHKKNRIRIEFQSRRTQIRTRTM